MTTPDTPQLPAEVLTSAADAERLDAELETAVRAVPGVESVFPTGATLSKVVDAGARLLGLRESNTPLVRVARSDERTRIETAIGVDATLSVVETMRRTHEVIETLLTTHGVEDAEISITTVYTEH